MFKIGLNLRTPTSIRLGNNARNIFIASAFTAAGIFAMNTMSKQPERDNLPSQIVYASTVLATLASATCAVGMTCASLFKDGNEPNKQAQDKKQLAVNA